MVEYTKINAKLSNLQLNKFKKRVKDNNVVTLRIGVKNFNKEDLPHELLLTTRLTTKLSNAINNNMSNDIKLSKVQIKEIIQSGGFLGKLLGPLLKTGLPLLQSVVKPLGLLGLTAASSAIDAGIQKKTKKKLGSGSTSKTTTLIISNEEMNDIMKIIQALENSGDLLKGVTKTIKNETKEQKGDFLSLLLGTLGASLGGNLLSGKGIKKKSLMAPHPLANFEIRKYYENVPKFNGVYSRNSLPKIIKTGAHVINLDEYADVGTHWIALYAKNNEVIYFDSFGVEHVPKEI